MEDDDAQIVDRIEMHIRRYLAENPHAADTARGIANWWLPPSFPSVPPERMARALDRLIRDGVLVRVELPGGTILYRRR
jgi:hypothetical protein